MWRNRRGVAFFEAAFGNDEAKPSGMGLEPADMQVHLFRKPETMAANLDELARGDERFQMTPEGGALVFGDSKQLKKLARAGWMMHALAHE